ncbi:protein containing Por secretion system C-terminal sorting domain [Lentimicrobium saccharophilum]|uniref:Protein containing Por secretion system C-terminal sorting domain n=1 Tax=Lentimicrobium saccharophilum TaxID=1678841 RepID=A0A0S7BTS7_9BACT|nr:YCF48-related protein [Lentimicrobium saccharophilum]GAP43869.1 protein containing Por secretion system C-terminal sorting domain [Lentimicrobium saccharophilum]
MKKLYILMFTLVTANCAMAQWFPQNSGTTSSLYSGYFTDANTGYVVGNSGTILKTTDGGTNWEAQYSGTLTSLLSVYFTDANTGYVVGYSGNILKTINGGTEWFLNSTDSLSFLSSVHFPSENIGYAVGYTSDTSYWEIGLVLKTSDGGLSWERHEFSNNSPLVLNSVYFTSADTGFVSATQFGWTGSCSGIIFKTTNGGNDWTTCFSFGQGECSGLGYLYFRDNETGFILGGSEGGMGHIFKTTDGGLSWGKINDFGMLSPASVCFPTPDTGYIVGLEMEWGQGIFLQTNDAGFTWSEPTVLTSYGLNWVYFTDSVTGYAVGQNGTILKTTNGGLTNLNEFGHPVKSLTLYPNPSDDKITIAAPAFSGNAHLSVFSIGGVKILERQVLEPEIQLDVRKLLQGVYVLKVANDKTVETAKLIKQ